MFRIPLLFFPFPEEREKDNPPSAEEGFLTNTIAKSSKFKVQR